jgi:hypothetical protein
MPIRDAVTQSTVWDLASGKLVSRSPDLKNEPHFVAISQDGKLAACGTNRGDLILWSPGTTKLHYLLRGDGRGWFRALAFSPDRKHLIVVYGTKGYECQRIAVASGKVEQRVPLGNPSEIALSPDGSTVATYDHPANRLLLHDTETGKKQRVMFDEKVSYLAVQFSDDLADADAVRAHRAVWQLTAQPGAEAFLARRLAPVEPVAEARLRSLVAGLGDASFATREKAEQALAAARDGPRTFLVQALRTTTDLEVRRRLQRLLKSLGPREPERLRESRAVLVLEARGTPEARRLLQRYAAGVAEGRLTREAKAAWRRLAEPHGAGRAGTPRMEATR